MLEQVKLQKILQKGFDERRAKNVRFSIRRYAKVLGVSPATVSETLQGKRILSHQTAKKILNYLIKDESRVENYINEMFFSKLRRNHNTSKMDFVSLSEEKFLLVPEWYHFAILSLVETADFESDPTFIAKRIGISKELAQKTIQNLLEHGFLKEENNQFIVTEKQFSFVSDKKIDTLSKFQKNSLKNAENTLDNNEVGTRDFSSLTMTFDPQNISLAKEFIKRFRREFCRQLETETKKEVYQLSIQFFPLSKEVAS